ncbi:MAG: branched-chain amino acid ABC transporter permease [Candidatus Promineifilaceae bacterium]|nr:branched-chain amino acid ABC transporter permease [Candidatus Promineifilaceae bacterium]
MPRTLRELDYVDLFLWLFRAVVIVIVVAGIVGKLFLQVGTNYSSEQWIKFFVAGLSQGSLYALIALGYTLVYGVLFMINFAHGEFFMSGTMTATIFVAIPLASAGFLERFPFMSLLAIMLTSMLISIAVALLTERVAYRPLRRAPRLVPLITAIGASFFWQYFFAGLYGTAIVPFPTIPALEGSVDILGVDVLKTRIVVMVSSVIMLIGLYWFVMGTKTGKAIRAVAEDKDVAALMGVDVDRTIAITFATGAAMAGAAGILYALLFSQTQFIMGFIPGIKAFTAAVLGGIGSVPGAALGGLFLGLIEALGPPLFLEGLGIPAAHQLKDVIAFTMLVLVLIFRPQGIIGERLAEKKA